jgi:hypothetical protein
MLPGSTRSSNESYWGRHWDVQGGRTAGQRDLDAGLLSGRLRVAGYLLPVRAYPMI